MLCYNLPVFVDFMYQQGVQEDPIDEGSAHVITDNETVRGTIFSYCM